MEWYQIILEFKRPWAPDSLPNAFLLVAPADEYKLDGISESLEVSCGSGGRGSGER